MARVYEVWRITLLGPHQLMGSHRYKLAARIHAWWVRGDNRSYIKRVDAEPEHIYLPKHFYITKAAAESLGATYLREAEEPLLPVEVHYTDVNGERQVVSVRPTGEDPA